MPIALVPTPFPRGQYDKAIRVQPLFNTLMHRARSDTAFLTDHLTAAAAVDDFTARLLGILHTVTVEGVAQSISLAIHRADYMLHALDETAPPVIKQVEINTISAAFGALTGATSRLHRFMFSRHVCTWLIRLTLKPEH